jgi:hypothetical protein
LGVILYVRVSRLNVDLLYTPIDRHKNNEKQLAMKGQMPKERIGLLSLKRTSNLVLKYRAFGLGTEIIFWELFFASVILGPYSVSTL